MHATFYMLSKWQHRLPWHTTAVKKSKKKVWASWCLKAGIIFFPSISTGSLLTVMKAVAFGAVMNVFAITGGRETRERRLSEDLNLKPNGCTPNSLQIVLKQIFSKSLAEAALHLICNKFCVFRGTLKCGHTIWWWMHINMKKYWNEMQYREPSFFRGKVSWHFFPPIQYGKRAACKSLSVFCYRCYFSQSGGRGEKYARHQYHMKKNSNMKTNDVY